MFTKLTRASLAPSTRSTLSLNQTLHGYVVNNIQEVPEFDLQVVQLEHQDTGAQHLHIHTDDPNNVFSVSFPTQPTDDTGVAHILEHTVLCGSEKYPVRDPFFNMLKRSMSTFMNAMTASDFTTYPFSTLNEVDYRNLMSVYLDATFFPQLARDDFLQEGHRFDFANHDTNPPSGLLYKGVVYNEMKGALANAEALYYHEVLRALYPNTTYHYNSGGLPSAIPDLTYEQLVDFHRHHYHPTNARFFTYGSFDLEPTLQHIHNHALSRFGPIQPVPDVPDVHRYTSPISTTVTGPANDMAPNPDKQVITGSTYLANDVRDHYTTFKLDVLSTLMFDGPSSPFFQALLASGLGDAFSPVTGYASYVKHTFLGAGVQGTSSDQVDNVLQTIQDTWHRVAHDSHGLSDKRIQGVLHQLEISRRVKGTDFGLSLLWALMRSWAHQKDPIETILLSKHIDALRADLQTGKVFEPLVQQYILDNPHRADVTMLPDADYHASLQRTEAQRLATLEDAFNDDQKRDIVDTARRLQERQDQDQDMSILPTLTRDDINPHGIDWNLVPTTVHDSPVFVNEQATNQVAIVHSLFDLPSPLPPHLQDALPLFNATLTRLGAADMDDQQLNQEIDLHTGGIGLSSVVHANLDDASSFTHSVLLGSRALDRNASHMSSLIRAVLNEPWHDDRALPTLRTLIASRASALTDSVAQNGHVFARTLAAAPLSPYHALCERLDGLSHVRYMNNLQANPEAPQLILTHFDQLSQSLFDPASLRTKITADRQTLDSATHDALAYLQHIGQRHQPLPSSSSSASDPSHRRLFYHVPFPVNYGAKAVPTVAYNHPDYPALTVAAKIMGANYLHREIREKGGAYGSGAIQGPGAMTFFSYRDPRTLETQQVFDDACTWLARGEFTQRWLDEAILSVFGQVDAPVALQARGNAQFLHNMTYDDLERRRQQYLAVSRDDIVDVAQRYLVDVDGSRAILGSLTDDLRTRLGNDWETEM